MNPKTDINRKNDFIADLRTDHLNSEQKLSVINICEKYCDIFHLPGEPLTKTNSIEHEIDFTQTFPFLP